MEKRIAPGCAMIDGVWEIVDLGVFDRHVEETIARSREAARPLVTKLDATYAQVVEAEKRASEFRKQADEQEAKAWALRAECDKIDEEIQCIDETWNWRPDDSLARVSLGAGISE